MPIAERMTVKPDASPDVAILDFDGTIVDSMLFLTDVATELLTSTYGMSPVEARSAYVRTCGLPFAKQLEVIQPGDRRNQATARIFERAKQEHLLEFALFPDVRQAIAIMRRNGLKVCVSSGNREHLIRKVLDTSAVEVDLVMGFRDGFMKGRDHFEFAGRRFGVPPQRIVFVGDSQQDALAAGEAGVGFIARIGLHTYEELERLLPGVPIVRSLLEVLPLIGIEAPQEERLKSP